jgi:hypothetical protein
MTIPDGKMWLFSYRRDVINVDLPVPGFPITTILLPPCVGTWYRDVLGAIMSGSNSLIFSLTLLIYNCFHEIFKYDTPISLVLLSKNFRSKRVLPVTMNAVRCTWVPTKPSKPSVGLTSVVLLGLLDSYSQLLEEAPLVLSTVVQELALWVWTTPVLVLEVEQG